MVKLKLKKSPIEVLEIELPSGDNLIINIKNPTVKESKQIQNDLIKLDSKLRNLNEHGVEDPLITNTEYSINTMKLLCEPFDYSKLDELEVEHIRDIFTAIKESKEKSAENKKKEKSQNFIKN